MRTKIYNGISGALKIICGAFFGVIVGYTEMDGIGSVIPEMTKSSAAAYIIMLLTVLFATAAYVGLLIKGILQIKSIFKPCVENHFVMLCEDVLALIFIAIAFKFIVPNTLAYFSDFAAVMSLILYAVSIILILTNVVILLIKIRKQKSETLSTENSMSIAVRLSRVVVPVFVIGLCIIFKAYTAANIEAMKLNQQMAGGFDSFTMSDFDGNEYTEDMFKGHKVNMINIWGTFCHPCIDEMPDLEEIAQMYDESDLQIIGIPADLYDYGSNIIDPDQVDTALNIIDRTGVKYRMLIPSPAIQTGVLGEVVGYPTTIFLDENGETIKVLVGSRDKNSWIETIEGVLADEK